MYLNIAPNIAYETGRKLTATASEAPLNAGH